MQNIDLLTNNSSLTNYYYYKSIFDDNEINQIKEISKKHEMQQGNVSGKVDHSYRKSNICWLPLNNETKFIYDKIIMLVKDANKNMWNFHITNLKEHLQFTEYNELDEGFYDWHMDIGSSNGTRKISVTIQLSDPNDYEGGDLEFMIHRNIIQLPREKGTVIFFPSYLLHRVNKVTRGVRNSLVLWFHGPPFV